MAVSGSPGNARVPRRSTAALDEFRSELALLFTRARQIP